MATKRKTTKKATLKRKGGGKLSRSEVVTVRLDPKLRFAAELAARKHRRTLSSFIEWAVEETVKKVLLVSREDIGPEYAFDAIENVWDVDEADRFAKLALSYPALLTHDEEVLWKLICENDWLWRGTYINRKWSWKINLQSLIFDRLRQSWEKLNAVAKGELSPDNLPKWEEHEEEHKETRNILF